MSTAADTAIAKAKAITAARTTPPSTTSPQSLDLSAATNRLTSPIASSIVLDMSTARTTYTATAPNGQTFTRKSARTITHAVLSQREDGTHGWISFNGSASLAAKSADAYAFLNPIIVPVTAS